MREHEGYKVSTALDRLAILLGEDEFYEQLPHHLNAKKEEIESFLTIGKDIRNGLFDKIKVLLYRNKSIKGDELYEEEVLELGEEETPEIETETEFDLDEWL